MPPTITCKNCGNTVPRNPRLKKKQKYCSAEECQKARRRHWKTTQYHQDDTYRAKCLAQQKQWRVCYPADQYQKTYREKHPDYVLRNRELQRQRNKTRKKQTQTTIVKTQTLLLQPREDGSYVLAKAIKEMIVNRNALSVQPAEGSTYALLGLEEGKIVNRNALMASGP